VELGEDMLSMKLASIVDCLLWCNGKIDSMSEVVLD
jgi:hypothetical protein